MPIVKASVQAIVVTHEPKPVLVRTLFATVARQVDGIVLVDNASRNLTEWLPKDSRGMSVLKNAMNLGLGAALNQGAERAIELGATHLLLLDQDSIPASDMVACLLSFICSQSGAVTNFAAVGPEWSDARHGRTRPDTVAREFVETDFLITSGMLVPVSAYRRVGSFDEGLFIDSTDREWCFRARSCGYCLARLRAAQLTHEIGDSVSGIRVLHRFSVSRHRPERLYFMMRNRLLLYRKKYVPLRWKCYDAVRALGKFILFSLVFAPRLANTRAMVTGLRDGLRGKTGPLDSES